MTGRVLSIERMCVHDGPGIRTTVYLKGCSLACRWCHNPESISPRSEIGLVLKKCVGCGRCVEACPVGAHRIDGNGHTLDRDLCTACGACVEACLPGALERHGTDTPASDVVAAVLADRTFYATSGGGCTISGGEPLLQAEFCAEALASLRREGIHSAIDTSGAVGWEAFEAVLPHTDLFLYDLKHTDGALHREHTGRSSRSAIGNLTRLSACDVPIEIRIPLIPGFNADERSIAAMGDALAGLHNVTRVRLLPYHLARAKYEAVGRTDTMPDVAPMDAAGMDELAGLLRRAGLNVTE